MFEEKQGTVLDVQELMVFALSPVADWNKTIFIDTVRHLLFQMAGVPFVVVELPVGARHAHGCLAHLSSRVLPDNVDWVQVKDDLIVLIGALTHIARTMPHNRAIEVHVRSGDRTVLRTDPKYRPVNNQHTESLLPEQWKRWEDMRLLLSEKVSKIEEEIYGGMENLFFMVHYLSEDFPEHRPFVNGYNETKRKLATKVSYPYLKNIFSAKEFMGVFHELRTLHVELTDSVPRWRHKAESILKTTLTRRWDVMTEQVEYWIMLAMNRNMDSRELNHLHQLADAIDDIRRYLTAGVSLTDQEAISKDEARHIYIKALSTIRGFEEMEADMQVTSLLLDNYQTNKESSNG